MKKNYIYAITTVLIWFTMAAMVKNLLSGLPDLETLSVSSAFGFLFLLMVNIRNGGLKQEACILNYLWPILTHYWKF